MDDISFLSSPSPNAELKIRTPDGEIKELQLNLEKIENACALFAFEFDDADQFMRKLLVQASSQTVMICFLRFLYTGTYMPSMDTSEPCRFLVHAELYRKAEIYDLAALQVQAYQNLLQELELACCLPQTSIDLCETITFLYEQLREHKSIIENVLHYVVSCFIYHRLNDDGGFRKLFYEHDMFRKDLATMNFKRGFQDEGAAEIIKLPADTPKTALHVIDDFLVRNDYPYELYPATSTTAGTKTETTDDSAFDSEPHQKRVRLAYRPRGDIQHIRALREIQAAKRDGYGSTTEESSASEAEGFTMVHRPKIQWQEIQTSSENASVATDQPVEGTTKFQVGFNIPRRQAKLDPSRFASDLTNILDKRRAASPFRRPSATLEDFSFADNSGSDSYDDALASSVDTIKPGTIKIVSSPPSFKLAAPELVQALKKADQHRPIQVPTIDPAVSDEDRKIQEAFHVAVRRKAQEAKQRKEKEAALRSSSTQEPLPDWKNSDRPTLTPAPVVVTGDPAVEKNTQEDGPEKMAASKKTGEQKKRKAVSYFGTGIGALVKELKESDQFGTAASSCASPPASRQQAASNPFCDAELVDVDSQSDSDSWSVVDKPSA